MEIGRVVRKTKKNAANDAKHKVYKNYLPS